MTSVGGAGGGEIMTLILDANITSSLLDLEACTLADTVMVKLSGQTIQVWFAERQICVDRNTRATRLEYKFDLRDLDTPPESEIPAGYLIFTVELGQAIWSTAS